MSERHLRNESRAYDLVTYDPAKQPKEAVAVCALDPLAADEAVHTLPFVNAAADVKGIVALLRPLVPSRAKLERFEPKEGLAAMRDLGLFMGSLKRHGVEPVSVVPEIEAVVFWLAELTDMPPRDTVIHYTSWNPDGDRRRHYTTHEAEHHLVTGTKISLPQAEEAIRLLVGWHTIPVDALEFPQHADAVCTALRGLIDNVLYATRHVPRQIFAEDLRPYFDPVTLRGVEYLGPGAVEVPTFVVDHLVWASRSTDAEYRKFKQTYLPYQRPWVRRVFREFDGRPSLLDKVTSALASDITPHHLAAATAVLKVLLSLVRFRAPHKRLADEAYTHSGKVSPDRSHGSGGYTTDILDYINKMTLTVRNTLRDMIHASLATFPGSPHPEVVDGDPSLDQRISDIVHD